MPFRKRGSNPHKSSFRLPVGIQPWERELKRFNSCAQEGFQFELLEDSPDSFRITAMANHSRILGLFSDFARQCFGDEAFLILEFYPDEWPKQKEETPTPTVFYSPYLPTGEIFQALTPYLERIIHDGFVGFGMANNRLGMEMFYSEEKVLTCFTGNHLKVMDLLAKHDLRHRQKLFLPADFGHDHLSLQCHGRHQLPEELAQFSDRDLDYLVFCKELGDALEMFPVEDGLAFFLSKKDQDQVERCLSGHPDYAVFADEDFGAVILDWNDFVEECERCFEGDLFEYQQGLQLRDLLQYVLEGVSPQLKIKLEHILSDPDQRFRKALGDHRKRLDPPEEPRLTSERFWYQGVCRNQGSDLRRDLIRHGWYTP